MNELIKYFEQVEARLAALEAAEQAEAAQEQKIAELTALVATLSAKVMSLEQKISDLEARPAAVIEKVVEIPANPEEPEVTEDEVKLDEETGLPELEVEFEEDQTNESEEIATEEETGLPELEVEFVDEPEEPAVSEVQEVQEVSEGAKVQETQETVSSVIPKLADIRKGISLADRFLFQRELFAGNGELMNKSVEAINALGSLAEAEAYIKKNFPDWNKESNAYELFCNLLKRRW